MMKLILVLLASALSMAQAARLGLLRVDSHRPTKTRPASTEFGSGSTRNLRKEGAFMYVWRELSSIETVSFQYRRLLFTTSFSLSQRPSS
jgi:hypothetical protein